MAADRDYDDLSSLLVRDEWCAEYVVVRDELAVARARIAELEAEVGKLGVHREALLSGFAALGAGMAKSAAAAG